MRSCTDINRPSGTGIRSSSSAPKASRVLAVTNIHPEHLVAVPSTARRGACGATPPSRGGCNRHSSEVRVLLPRRSVQRCLPGFVTVILTGFQDSVAAWGAVLAYSGDALWLRTGP